MHWASEELGQSYARIQRRVVELEEAVGLLVVQQRGGEGDVGSSLTENARRLLDQFDRLRAEFADLARVEESVFDETVTEQSGQLGTISTVAGPVRAIVMADAEAVQVSVQPDAVVLTDPEDAPDPDGTSVWNRFDRTVERVDEQYGLDRVTVDVGRTSRSKRSARTPASTDSTSRPATR